MIRKKPRIDVTVVYTHNLSLQPPRLRESVTSKFTVFVA